MFHKLSLAFSGFYFCVSAIWYTSFAPAGWRASCGSGSDNFLKMCKVTWPIVALPAVAVNRTRRHSSDNLPTLSLSDFCHAAHYALIIKGSVLPVISLICPIVLHLLDTSVWNNTPKLDCLPSLYLTGGNPYSWPLLTLAHATRDSPQEVLNHTWLQGHSISACGFLVCRVRKVLLSMIYSLSSTTEININI